MVEIYSYWNVKFSTIFAKHLFKSIHIGIKKDDIKELDFTK